MQKNPKAPYFFKIGATLVIPAQAQDDTGAGIDLTSITLKSQLRNEDGKLIDTMTVQWVDRVNGSYALWLSGTGTTDGYKPGLYMLDVFYTEPLAGFGGRPVVVATETLTIEIGRAETQVAP